MKFTSVTLVVLACLVAGLAVAWAVDQATVANLLGIARWLP